MTICVQTEGSPAKDTNRCSLLKNLRGKSISKSTEDVTGEPCRQAGEDIPRGIIVATTDLQLRSLTEEDEKEVGLLTKLLPFTCCDFNHLTISSIYGN